MNSISVIIHTHNEEKNIEECISSARLLTDDILLIDMESSDRTVSKATGQNVEIRTFPFSQYVEPAREFGITNAQGEWVFILDADERITPELVQEIQQILFSTPAPLNTYYRVPRKNIFGRKQWLKHGGWWPDKQIRMIHKAHFKEWPNQIHSTPQIDGKEGELNNPILHYFHGDLATMVNKTTIYEEIESELLFKAHREAQGSSIFFRKFFGELFRRLIKQQGYLDGAPGIIESIYQAYSKTITYLYLYEKKQNSTV